MPLGPSFAVEVVRRQAVTLRHRAGPPADVTGWALRWVLSDTPGGEILLAKTEGAGLTVSSPTTGVIDVALTRSDTAGLTAGRSYYAGLWRTDAGAERPLREGVVRVIEGVWQGPTGDALLLEQGGYLLAESGDFLLLE